MTVQGPKLDPNIRDTYVGKYGRVVAGGFTIHVKIKDARSAYGRVDLLVTPMAGAGDKWVRATSIDHVWE